MISVELIIFGRTIDDRRYERSVSAENGKIYDFTGGKTQTGWS